MIEKTVLDYLNTALSVPCYMQEPANPNPAMIPKSFVVLQKTGSSVQNHIYNATFAVQSYAGTLYNAANLNEAVKTAMREIINITAVTRCELMSDYEFTKVSTKQPRYQAVFELTYYEE